MYKTLPHDTSNKEHNGELKHKIMNKINKLGCLRINPTLISNKQIDKLKCFLFSTVLAFGMRVLVLAYTLSPYDLQTLSKSQITSKPSQC